MSLALASAVVGAQRLIPQLDDRLARYGRLTPAQAARSPGDSIPLPADVYAFYARHVRRDDRFYLVAGTSPTGIDRPLVVRSYAWFVLGPAVELFSPERATVVLGYDARSLPRPFRHARVIRMPGRPGFFVARRASS